MKKKAIKTKNPVTLKDVDKKIDGLVKTVDDLAQATARGFENAATKQDLGNLRKDFENLENRFDGLEDKFERMENKFENLSKDVNNSIEDFTKNVRVDYDALAARVKRLEVTVFKR